MKAAAVSLAPAMMGDVALPEVRLYADSAIGRDVMPLFIPDILGGWTARVCPAWRIVRLGKNIPERFALRYIDAYGLVLVLRPGADAEAFYGSGAYSVMDSMITTGHWLSYNGAEEPMLLTVNDAAYDIPTDRLGAASRLALLSRVATVKSGDLIIAEDAGIDVSLTPNTYITCTLAGTPCLRVKVK